MYGYDDISGYGEEIITTEGYDDDLGYDDYDIGYDDDDLGWDDDDLGYDDDDLGYDEMVGDEVDALLAELSGDDDDLGYDDMVGRRRRRRRPPRPRYRSRSRRRRRPSRRRRRSPRPKMSQTMRQIRPSQARRYPLGVGTTALAANATAVITVNPQLPFKLMRLSTPSTNVTIDNIQIGTVSQFVAAGGIPAEVFAPNAIGVDLKGDTAVPGVQIQITVTDTSGAANTFRGAFFGLVAQ
jgi:hypothetical protein